MFAVAIRLARFLRTVNRIGKRSRAPLTVLARNEKLTEGSGLLFGCASGEQVCSTSGARATLFFAVDHGLVRSQWQRGSDFDR